MEISKKIEFYINPQRLQYLLDLYKFSKKDFLKALQGKNKNPILNLEEINKILKKEKKVNIIILKKIDEIFEKGIGWYLSKRNLLKKDKLSIFFRKDKFNADLNFGSIKLIEKFEKKKIEIEIFSNYINFDTKSKLKFNLKDNPKNVAIQIRKEFDKIENKLKEKKILKSSKSEKNFLENLIRIIEELNIFVFEFIDKKRKEDLIANFNGFFMSPNLIVIKRQQKYFKREIFTLMHEFAHYLIETEEIDINVGESITNKSNVVEKWCNDFTYYFLIKNYDEKLKQLSNATPQNNFHKEIINEITNQTYISNFALYTRLRINNQMSLNNYNKIYDEIKNNIFKKEQKIKAVFDMKKEEAKALGKNFFIPAAKPIESKLYKELIKLNYFEGNISENRVMQSLNIKNKPFEEVIYS